VARQRALFLQRSRYESAAQHIAICREHLPAQDYIDHSLLVFQRDERRATCRRRVLPGPLAQLLSYTHIFAALDADNTGMPNATRLAALSVRVTPASPVPEGNDVTEYHQVGANVQA